MVPNAGIILIRGLPGSGKTTLAKRLQQVYADQGLDVAHVEADMYFERDGEYKFDPTQLKKAHNWCQGVAEVAIKSGKPVIVSNTFTRHSEMAAYLDIADKYNASVNVIRCNGEYGTIHGVPEASIEKMRNRFEDYDGEQIVV